MNADSNIDVGTLRILTRSKLFGRLKNVDNDQSWRLFLTPDGRFSDWFRRLSAAFQPDPSS